jgi:hypothetical protein
VTSDFVVRVVGRSRCGSGHLSDVRERTGHALIRARQWIEAEDIADPVKSLLTVLPLDLRSGPRTSWARTS